MNDLNWLPGAIAGSFAVLAAVASGIITGVLQARRERKKDQRDSLSPGAPSTQQVWERQDRMERAFKAALVLLGESVEQHDNPGSLVFNRVAIKTLRDSGFMPSELENVLTDQDQTKEN